MYTYKVVSTIVILCGVWCIVFSSDGCHGNGTLYNCSNAGLTLLPAGSELSADYEVLDLSHNHIENITYLDYENVASKLSELFLNNNQISIIRNNSFMLLTNLVYLDLSSNLIAGSSLDEHMFDDLRKLTTLNLERNPLRYLKKNTFNFMELPSILSLDISHSQISTIEEGAFDLPSLESLDLSWNDLESFDREAFHMMVDLRLLDMSHNRIKVLDSVPYLPEIRTWNLDNNAIEQVLIADQVWQYADSLEQLTLRNNQIMRFNEESLPLDLDTLTLLDMTNNELQCDCRMTWIKLDEIDRTNRTLHIPCVYPTSLKGKNLLDVPRDELQCGYPLYQILLGVGLILLVVTCVASVLFFVVSRRKGRRPYKKSPKPNDIGGNYTAVYTKEDDDVTVQTPDDRRLIEQEKEFDV